VTDREDLKRMRAGIGARVARVAKRAGGGLRRMTPAGVLALLCAGAFGPILIVPGLLGAGALAAAGVGVLGSVGANVLTDVLLRTIRRAEQQGIDDPQAVEDELALVIEEMLLAGDAQAASLRSELAELLRAIGGASAALEAALDSGDVQVQADLAAALTRIGVEFAEFDDVLADLRIATAAIQETLLRQDIDHRMDRERARDQSLQLRLLRDKLAVLVDRRDVGASGVSEVVAWSRGAPYRGLLPFDEDHEGVFYGRERMTALLVGKAGQRLSGPGLVVVTGASGAGKSSLIRAGFLPSVARGMLTAGSELWPRIAMTPTHRPLEELATRLAALTGGDPSTTLDALTKKSDLSHLIARQVVLADTRQSDHLPARLVLVVDQFEQAFTIVGDRDREQFLDVLRNLATARSGEPGHPPALIVLGVRGDFWDRCVDAVQLSDLLDESLFTVGPMSEADLRRVITGPASAAGLTLDTALTDTLLADLRSLAGPAAFDVGALPLLSQAMLLTWNERDGNRLTLSGYGLSGGVEHAVSTSAENTFSALTAPQQEVATTVFRQLAIVSSSGQVLSRPAARQELVAAISSEHTEELVAVLDTFADHRLLILREGTVEIAHDTLLHAWPRLYDWLADKRGDRLLLERLNADVAHWTLADRDRSSLPRGSQLAALSDAVERWNKAPDSYPSFVVSQDAKAFLGVASRAAARTKRIRQLTAAVLVILIIAVGTSAVIAERNAAEARNQHYLALSRQLVAQSELLLTTDPLLAQQLALAAWHYGPSATTRFTMIQALDTKAKGVLTGHTDLVPALAVSSDGHVLATGSKDTTVRLWDLETQDQIGEALTGHRDLVRDVAFSPDGTVLASASLDDTVRLWNVKTRTQIGSPLQHDTDVNAVKFSPNGRFLATSSADGRTQLWDTSSWQKTGAPFGDDGDKSPADLAFSPDSSTLAAGHRSGFLRTWNVETRTQVGEPIKAHDQFLNRVLYSPNGELLATASDDGTVSFWNPVTKQRIGKPLTGHTGRIYGLAFSPNGETLATTSADKTVRLWTISNLSQPGQPLVGHTDTVFNAVFSHDGRTLVTSGIEHDVRLWDPVLHRRISQAKNTEDGTTFQIADDTRSVVLGIGQSLTLWDIEERKQIGSEIGDHKANIQEVAISADRRILASITQDEVLSMWDVENGRRIGEPLKASASTNDLIFSPDGRVLVVTGLDNQIRLFDTQTGKEQDSSALRAKKLFGSVAFTPDSRILATKYGSEVQLWDFRAQKPIGDPIRVPSNVLPMRFSPDGRTLAVGETNKVISFWDIDTREQKGEPLTGFDAEPSAIAFSPDGRTIAAGTFRNLQVKDQPVAIRLWDAATRRQIGASLMGHMSDITTLAFSADSTSLVSASSGNLINRWDTTPYPDPAKIICDRLGAPSEAQWAKYSSGEPLVRMCD